MASHKTWRGRLVQMARELGIQAEAPPWALFGGAARGPYRGLDAMLRIRHNRGSEWLIVSLAHSRPLNLGLHASPRTRPGACDDCDVFARDRQLGPTPGVLGYADDQEGAERLMASPAVRAAFVAFETAEPIDRFATHVNDSVVWVQLDPDGEPTAGLVEAMHGLSQALASDPRLPSTPAAPPARRSLAARILFLLLVPPVFFGVVMGLGSGVGEWAAFTAIALAGCGVVWAGLRRYLRRGSRQ